LISVSKYSQLIVKVGAERSYLIERKKIESLAESRDLSEFASRLKGSPYESLIRNVTQISAKELQRVFKEELIRVYTEMVKFSPVEIKNFLKAYVSYLEIENLKTLLKMKHMKLPAEVLMGKLHLSIEELFGMKEKFVQAAKAEDVKTAVEMFGGTPYEPILMEGLTRYNETGSTKFFDFSLDRAYFDKLLFSAQSVPKKDREIALHFAGLKVDMFNILTAIRSNLLKYPPHLVYRAITHRFYKLSERSIRDLVSSGDIDSALNRVKQTFYGRFLTLQESLEESIFDFERKIRIFSLKFLEKRRLADIFSIASPLDLIMRKENELENLTIISSGIEFGWKPEALIPILI